VSRVIPEEDSELFKMLEGEKFKKIITTRTAYYKALEELNSKETEKEIKNSLSKEYKERKQHVKDSKKESSCSQIELYKKIRKTSIYIEMPYEKMKKYLQNKGFLKNNFPCTKAFLTNMPAIDIIQYYTKIAQDIINFYQCVDNKRQFIKIIN
jgi:adenosylmethionine-8-amino-7-oxononanoate aminotransferase